MHFTFTSAGESHGPQLTIIVTGMPAGVRLDRERINRDMARRQHGYGRGGGGEIEDEEADIVCGGRGGGKPGPPLSVVGPPTDFEKMEEGLCEWDARSPHAR